MYLIPYVFQVAGFKSQASCTDVLRKPEGLRLGRPLVELHPDFRMELLLLLRLLHQTLH